MPQPSRQRHDSTPNPISPEMSKWPGSCACHFYVPQCPMYLLTWPPERVKWPKCEFCVMLHLDIQDWRPLCLSQGFNWNTEMTGQLRLLFSFTLRSDWFINVAAKMGKAAKIWVLRDVALSYSELAPAMFIPGIQLRYRNDRAIAPVICMYLLTDCFTNAVPGAGKMTKYWI